MRMRGMRGETGQGQDGAIQQSLGNSSSEGQTTDQERSSVTEPAADSVSANGLLDLEEPVLLVTDKRIRNLMAQITTEKMVLENTLKDLKNKQRDTDRFKTGARTLNFWLKSHSTKKKCPERGED